MSPAEPVLEMEGVRFGYPGAGVDAVDVPALALAAGERLLLRGDSGCGKSTLLSLAAGVLLPRAGRVCLLGRDWRTLGAAARDARRVDHVGYIFQRFNLLPYLSMLDNVLLPCRFSALRARRASAAHGSPRAAAAALLAALDLDPALHGRAATALSVGQQQRVAAARALIGEPELVIADEPTSALDEARRDGFMALLAAQCTASRSALLFVTHDARLAPAFQRVVRLTTAGVPLGPATAEPGPHAPAPRGPA